MTQRHYSKEFELIVTWCAEFLSPKTERSLPNLAGLNIQDLLLLTKKHKVSSLAPLEPEYWADRPDILKELKVFNKKKRQHALQQGATLFELKRLLGDSDIEFMVMKGLLLSQKLYGDIAFRSSLDIDILVQQKDTLKGHALLKKNGFVQHSPALQLTQSNSDVFQKLSNQIAYNNNLGIQLELHWSLFKKKRTISHSPKEVWSHKIPTKILDQDFTMLDDRLLFQYLYIHGARHQYLSLIWLLDFATLCKSLHPDELEWQVQFAKKNDTDRYLYLSLALTKKLFNLDFGITYPHSRRLQKQLKWVGLHFSSEIDRKSSISYNFGSIMFQISLKKSLLYKADYFELYSINDYKALPLSKALTGLYFILRPFLFALRYLSKRGK